MTGTSFINAMGKIDEKYVIEALNYQRPARRRPQVRLTIRRSVIAASLAVVVVFSGLMTVEAYREKVIEVIVQVFHDLTDYRYISNVEDRDMPEIEFGFIPDGMTETTHDVNERRRSVLYEADSGDFFDLYMFQIQPGDSLGQIIDTEDAIVEEFEINGNEAVAVTKNGTNTITWDEYNVVYRMQGNIDLDALKEIARNLKIIYDE